MRQWMLRITAYAERLLDDLGALDWSESLKEMQRNWIGRSAGAEVDFHWSAQPPHGWETSADRPRQRCSSGTLPSSPPGPTRCSAPPTWCWRRSIPWSTRSPRPSAAAEVEAYREQAARKSDLERTELAKEKTGVFTGAYAINPVNGEKIPIWIADYVLISYGTGAIMAVPAHDTRDFEFASKFNLPIVAVVEPAAEVCDRAGGASATASWRATARPIHSGLISGSATPEVKRKITDDLATEGARHRATINYKLRDWLFSRQRYLGRAVPDPARPGRDGTTGAVREPADRTAARLPELETTSPPAPASRRWRTSPSWREHRPIPRRPAGQARDQHHAAMGRLVLVLPALRRPARTTSAP